MCCFFFSFQCEELVKIKNFPEYMESDTGTDSEYSELEINNYFSVSTVNSQPITNVSKYFFLLNLQFYYKKLHFS